MKRKHPNHLTTDEWNLLQWLTTYNHMDCWFELHDTKSGYDLVYDTENRRWMSLHDSIETICEGLCEQDLILYENGQTIWNEMMERFSLEKYKILKKAS